MKTTPEPKDKQWPLGEPIRKESESLPDWYRHPDKEHIEVNRTTGQWRTKLPYPQWP